MNVIDKILNSALKKTKTPLSKIDIQILKKSMKSYLNESIQNNNLNFLRDFLNNFFYALQAIYIDYPYDDSIVEFIDNFNKEFLKYYYIYLNRYAKDKEIKHKISSTKIIYCHVECEIPTLYSSSIYYGYIVFKINFIMFLLSDIKPKKTNILIKTRNYFKKLFSKTRSN